LKTFIGRRRPGCVARVNQFLRVTLEGGGGGGGGLTKKGEKGLKRAGKGKKKKLDQGEKGFLL